jgi:hypothetical protein
MTTTSDEEVNRSRRINDATDPDVVSKCCTWYTGKLSEYTVKVIYAGRQMEERRGEERRALQEHHLCVAAV